MKTKIQKHTPGPLNFHSQCSCTLAYPPEGAIIVYCPKHAAAPEMRIALLGVLAALDLDKDHGLSMLTEEMVRDALAKAQGQEE